MTAACHGQQVGQLRESAVYKPRQQSCQDIQDIQLLAV